MKPLLFVSFLLSVSTFAQTTRDPLFTSFDGTRIHYDVLGEGKPVVLLHGFITNGESWKRAPVRQALADAGFRVVTLDLRGNGRSDKPHTAEAYRDNAELKDVMALMKHLKLTNYDVVGYSRGAILTAKLITPKRTGPIPLRWPGCRSFSPPRAGPNWASCGCRC